MLRFNRDNRHPPNYLSQREQLRVLRLVLAVALVVLLINAVSSPRAAQMLGIFFGAPQQADHADQNGPADPATPAARGTPPAPRPASRNQRQASPPAAVAGLSEVKDNTPFRTPENAPWYRLLGVLHDAAPRELAAGSLGDVTAVQLLEQPAAYRGRLVDIRGTARQVISSDPLASRPDPRTLVGMYFQPLAEFPAFAWRTTITHWFLGDYHRVVIQQPGAAVPIIVFTLGVPDGFPKGEAVSERVSVSGGYFFKNWLFAADDGIGVAPVVLAKHLEWQPAPPPAPGPQPPETADIGLVLGSALLLAIGVTWWLVNRSRAGGDAPVTHPATHGTPPDFSFVPSGQTGPRDPADWQARIGE